MKVINTLPRKASELAAQELFINFVKHERKMQMLTQKALAFRMGVARAEIVRIEINRKVISYEYSMEILNALSRTYQDVVNFIERQTHQETRKLQ